MPSYDTFDEILAALSTCTETNNKVFFFKNKDYDEKSDRHFHLAIPISKDEYMLLVMFSSKVEKTIRRYELIGKGIDSLIIFKKNDLDFLTADESVLDCNKPLYLSYEELAAKIEGKLSIFKSNIQETDLIRIKKAIIDSPHLKPTLKKKLM